MPYCPKIILIYTYRETTFLRMENMQRFMSCFCARHVPLHSLHPWQAQFYVPDICRCIRSIRDKLGFMCQTYAVAFASSVTSSVVCARHRPLHSLHPWQARLYVPDICRCIRFIRDKLGIMLIIWLFLEQCADRMYKNPDWSTVKHVV